MSNGISKTVQRLLDRGVRMPAPATVWVGDDVVPECIAPGVVLHPGCRVAGARTAIGKGSLIGEEQPVTVRDCQMGREVSLKGGYFEGATFLDGASAGSGAHIRPGTLLEEEASVAHTVGLKQTILLPFVTAGSLINFCDCLMGGGTSRQDHSEIGSSYIHFNFTPHGDKATASLVGDVPRGVMLDQPRIFLGGQGGLVGPVRLGFGTVIPAGTIWRKDAPAGGQLLVPPPEHAQHQRPFVSGAYKSVDRLVLNNLVYIGNLCALKAWYDKVRRLWMERDTYDLAVWAGAVRRIDEGLEERVKRLGELADRMDRSLVLAAAEHGQSLPEHPYAGQSRLWARWPQMKERLQALAGRPSAPPPPERLSAALAAQPAAQGYLAAIRNLSADVRKAGTAWLQAIVDEATVLWTVAG